MNPESFRNSVEPPQARRIHAEREEEFHDEVSGMEEIRKRDENEERQGPEDAGAW